LAANVPNSDIVLAEILKFFSVEKVVFAQEQRNSNPAKLKRLLALLGDRIEQETISHEELKRRCHSVKGVIRTGDFSAFTNLLLVSGAGDRWIMEK
jgi:D-ribose pyranase